MSLIHERTVLACLHKGVWSGMKRDEEVNEEVAERHKAEKDAGNYNKRLIASKWLKGVHQKGSVLTRTHKLLTLPWEDGGVRILAARSYVSYTDNMRYAKQGFQAAVLEFQQHYPDAIADRKKELGSLFNQEDYPLADEVAKKFWVDIEIKPVTKAGDFRAELSDTQTKAIIKDIERRTDERLNKALNDVFERVAERVEKMMERLRSYDPTSEEKGTNFQDSLVWNIKEIAELLPDLNITNDKRIDELHTKLIDDLVEHTPEVLKSDPGIRRRTADKAEALLKKVQKYMV